MKRYQVVYELSSGKSVITSMYGNTKPTRQDVQNMAYSFGEGLVIVKAIKECV